MQAGGQFIYKPQKELMLDHIILTVSNFAEAVAFYEAVLPHLNMVERQDYDGKDGPPGHPDLKGFGANGRLLAAGYEDLNDHNLLRLDPLFAVAVGKEDPLGSGRAAQDQGKALACASTLNRLELGNNKNTRCHKISADHEAIEDNLLLMGVRCLPKHSLEVVIDLDTTDDPLHGHQEGRFFHGFYGCYCYLPLFAFVGSVPLWAQLRTSEGDAARGAVDALGKIVAAVRKRCRKARIIVRADSGFCREELMAWCEAQQPVVYYCLGLARNSRLRELIDEK